MKLSGKLLLVQHYPQIPCNPFCVPVKDEYEAVKIINMLANQHIWLLENKIITDYSNGFSVSMWADGKWESYFNHEEIMDWETFEETYRDILQ